MSLSISSFLLVSSVSAVGGGSCPLRVARSRRKEAMSGTKDGMGSGKSSFFKVVRDAKIADRDEEFSDVVCRGKGMTARRASCYFSSRVRPRELGVPLDVYGPLSRTTRSLAAPTREDPSTRLLPASAFPLGHLRPGNIQRDRSLSVVNNGPAWREQAATRFDR